MDSDDEDDECCPTCIEPLDEKGETKIFLPCPCNYRVCMFCVRRIQTEFDGRCPGCRRDYEEKNFLFVDKPPAAVKTRRKRKVNKYPTAPGAGNVGANGHGHGPAHGHGHGHGHGHARNSSTGPPLGNLPSHQHQHQHQQNKNVAPTLSSNTAFPATLGAGAGSGSGSGAGTAPAVFFDAATRKELSNVRVVQRNLVYLVCLAPSIAREETLRSRGLFGQYGRIVKVAVNKSSDRERGEADAPGPLAPLGGPGPAGGSSPAAGGQLSYSAYITFARDEDALTAIRAVNGFCVDGCVLKASFGTTKYCNMFLRGLHCSNSDCLYLHKLGDVASSFTKEEMHAGMTDFQDMTQSSGSAGSAGRAAHTASASASATATANVGANAYGAWGAQPGAGAGGAASAATWGAAVVPPSPSNKPSGATGGASAVASISTPAKKKNSPVKKQKQKQKQQQQQQQQQSKPHDVAQSLATLGGILLADFEKAHPRRKRPARGAPGAERKLKQAPAAAAAGDGTGADAAAAAAKAGIEHEVAQARAIVAMQYEQRSQQRNMQEHQLHEQLRAQKQQLRLEQQQQQHAHPSQRKHARGELSAATDEPWDPAVKPANAAHLRFGAAPGERPSAGNK